VIGEILWRGKIDMVHGGDRAKTINIYSPLAIVKNPVPTANELRQRTPVSKAVGCSLLIMVLYDGRVPAIQASDFYVRGYEDQNGAGVLQEWVCHVLTPEDFQRLSGLPISHGM